MALGIEGLRIGTWTSPGRISGCTVLLPPEGSLGAVAVRGGSPGTREAIALGPNGKLTVCHGVVLSGGSAFGLSAADGVVRWLEAHGIGYDKGVARIPIVGAAILLDASIGRPDERPGPESGWAACEAASSDDPPEGGVGAGTGCTVATVGGLDHAWASGQGIAVERHGDLVVGALVANNAAGDILDGAGGWLARSRAPEDQPRFPFVPVAPPSAHGDDEVPSGDGTAASGGPVDNTVIGCVVTNARLDKLEAFRVADLAHTGVARVCEPAHSSVDGDALFCLATGEVDAAPDAVAMLAARAVERAARRAVETAGGRGGLPGRAG